MPRYKSNTDSDLQAVPALSKTIITDIDAHVRIEAVNALSKYYSGRQPYFVDRIPHRQEMVFSLITALHDSDDMVIANSAQALGRLASYITDSSLVSTELIQLIKLDKPLVRVNAIYTLGIYRSKPAVPILLQFLTSPILKEVVISSLCRIGDPDSVSQMQTMLGTDFKQVRKPLILGLAATNDPKAMKIIISWIHDPDPDIRETVILALAQSSGKNIEQALLTALKDTTQDNRVAAMSILNQKHPKLESRNYLLNLSIPDKVQLISKEMNLMAAGLEAYYVDNGSYPLMQHYPKTLTTPVAYIHYFPADPFTSSPIKPFRYYTPPTSQEWILVSDGPDQTMNIDLSHVQFNPFKSENLKPLNYNPTNGIYSNGDIWRQGP
jgi:HEAT repeat protein